MTVRELIKELLKEELKLDDEIRFYYMKQDELIGESCHAYLTSPESAEQIKSYAAIAAATGKKTIGISTASSAFNILRF